MNDLLLPLTGAMFVISLAVDIVIVAALIDVAMQRADAFVAAGKQTKVFWIVILAIGFFISLVGLVAAIVYFVDVRPAVRQYSGRGGSSSDGPYGPWR